MRSNAQILAIALAAAMCLMGCDPPVSLYYEVEVENQTSLGPLHARFVQLTHNFLRGETVRASETVVEPEGTGYLKIGGETDDENILFAIVLETYNEDDSLNPARVGVKLFRFEDISRYPFGPDGPPVKRLVVTDNDLHLPEDLDSVGKAVIAQEWQ